MVSHVGNVCFHNAAQNNDTSDSGRFPTLNVGQKCVVEVFKDSQKVSTMTKLWTEGKKNYHVPHEHVISEGEEKPNCK